MNICPSGLGSRGWQIAFRWNGISRFAYLPTFPDFDDLLAEMDLDEHSQVPATERTNYVKFVGRAPQACQEHLVLGAALSARAICE